MRCSPGTHFLYTGIYLRNVELASWSSSFGALYGIKIQTVHSLNFPLQTLSFSHQVPMISSELREFPGTNHFWAYRRRRWFPLASGVLSNMVGYWTWISIHTWKERDRKSDWCEHKALASCAYYACSEVWKIIVRENKDSICLVWTLKKSHEDLYNTCLFLTHKCSSLLEVHQVPNMTTKMSKESI